MDGRRKQEEGTENQKKSSTWMRFIEMAYNPYGF